MSRNPKGFVSSTLEEMEEAVLVEVSWSFNNVEKSSVTLHKNEEEARIYVKSKYYGTGTKVRLARINGLSIEDTWQEV